MLRGLERKKKGYAVSPLSEEIVHKAAHVAEKPLAATLVALVALVALALGNASTLALLVMSRATTTSHVD
jgi:hypothetical protein